MADSLVSIVMPVYNAAATLRRSIDSVLAQSHAGFELLAVDDGSRDESLRILDDYATRDPRVHALRMPSNGGVAAARNHALAAARGNFIAFLDSDDGWHPDKLERQLAGMRTQSAKVSYTAYDRVGEDGALLSRVRPPASVTYADMLKSNRIGNLTGMYDRTLGDARFQKVGHEDYVFWLERVRLAGRAICVDPDVPLAWYLVRAGSVSSNKVRAARWQWHIYREIEQLGNLASMWYMLHYGMNAFLKRV